MEKQTLFQTTNQQMSNGMSREPSSMIPPRRILQQERLGLSLVQHPQHFEKEFPTRIVEAETLTASLGRGQLAVPTHILRESLPK